MKHGTISGYDYWKCPCGRCKAANARKHDNFRLRMNATGYIGENGRWYVPDAPHGTKNGYTNYTCRCDECGDAHKEPKAS